MAKFGGHVLRHLASRLIRQGSREGGRQTKNLVLAFFLKLLQLLLCLYTIFGFSNVKAVFKKVLFVAYRFISCFF